MATMCLFFNLLGLATALAGGLTAAGIFPGFIEAGSSLSTELVTTLFWFIIAVVLLLSGIAFGVYNIEEKPVAGYDRELPPEA